MNRWYLAVAAPIILGACDVYLDITIYTPDVEIVETNSGDSAPTPRPAGNNPITTLNLPVCFLSRCDSGDCSLEIQRTMVNTNRGTLSDLGVSRVRVIQISNQGYYARVSTSQSLSSIAPRWSEASCVQRTSDADDAIAARRRECTRHMGGWTTQATSESVQSLSLDQRFRRTCLRES